MIHQNSEQVYDAIIMDGSKDGRLKRVLEIITEAPKPLSDYQILQELKAGSDNLNLVSPRITELYQMVPPVVVEGPPVKSHCKNTNVRTTELIKINSQTKLF